jgi:hypothetical protein
MFQPHVAILRLYTLVKLLHWCFLLVDDKIIDEMQYLKSIKLSAQLAENCQLRTFGVLSVVKWFKWNWECVKVAVKYQPESNTTNQDPTS